MLWLIKQVYTGLLSFRGSLATRCVSLTNEPCMVRRTLIDLNRIELNYYLFMISLDKCNGSYNTVDDLSTKICLPSKTKEVTVEAFNLITRKNEPKTSVKLISCDCK